VSFLPTRPYATAEDAVATAEDALVTATGPNVTGLQHWQHPTVARRHDTQPMGSTEPRSSGPRISRHAVSSSSVVGIPIDELAETLAPRNDASRWNRFVVASIAGSNVVAVVAPIGSSSVFRLRGETAHQPDKHGFTVHASGGVRGRGLRITHEVTLSPAGSLHTTVLFVTKWRGPLASFVNRRRVGEWHRAEVDALETRTERKHPRREAPVPRFGHNEKGDRRQRARERGMAVATNRGEDTNT
jgi:hypothetical protein